MMHGPKKHIDAILALDLVDARHRGRALQGGGGCREFSVGGVAVPKLLKALGVEVVADPLHARRPVSRTTPSRCPPTSGPQRMPC
jgi:hypothetical protein